MKAFRFGDMLRAIYPGDPEASENKRQAALYVAARVDNGDAPMLVCVNPLARLANADPDTIVEQGEEFTVQGVGYRCVTVEGFALGFDKL